MGFKDTYSMKLLAYLPDCNLTEHLCNILKKEGEWQFIAIKDEIQNTILDAMQSVHCKEIQQFTKSIDK